MQASAATRPDVSLLPSADEWQLSGDAPELALLAVVLPASKAAAFRWAAIRARTAKAEKKTKRYPSDLTDEEWCGLSPFFPCIENPRAADEQPSGRVAEVRPYLNSKRGFAPVTY